MSWCGEILSNFGKIKNGRALRATENWTWIIDGWVTNIVLSSALFERRSTECTFLRAYRCWWRFEGVCWTRCRVNDDFLRCWYWSRAVIICLSWCQYSTFHWPIASGDRFGYIRDRHPAHWRSFGLSLLRVFDSVDSAVMMMKTGDRSEFSISAFADGASYRGQRPAFHGGFDLTCSNRHTRPLRCAKLTRRWTICCSMPHTNIFELMLFISSSRCFAGRLFSVTLGGV
jgi:hypothetical protein